MSDNLSTNYLDYKAVLPIDEQVNHLRQRGLLIRDVDIVYLERIGLHRLKPYIRHFQKNDGGKDWCCSNPTKFRDVLLLYDFDKEVRAALLEALQEIEVGFYAHIVNEMCKKTKEAHWHLDFNQFDKISEFSNFIYIMEKAIHHKKNSGGKSEYVNTVQDKEEEHSDFYIRYGHMMEYPPCWSTFRVLSFTAKSKCFNNLNTGHKSTITRSFSGGKLDRRILQSWMHTLSNLRNHCAHHHKIWDTTFPIKLRTVKSAKNKFSGSNFLYELNGENILNKHNNASVYGFSFVLVVLLEVLGIEWWTNSFMRLISECPTGELSKMGFLGKWYEDDFWKDRLDKEIIDLFKSKDET